jgi:hypothetical protein
MEWDGVECDIVVEGQPKGERHADKMGVYHLLSEAGVLEEVNGRAVWQKTDGDTDCYAYFARNDMWVFGEEESMREGAGRGWMCTVDPEPDALTPDGVQGRWQAGSDMDVGWVTVPQVRVRNGRKVMRQSAALTTDL